MAIKKFQPPEGFKRVRPQFQPSAELKAARELLETAQASGHPRPILTYEGLETFFRVLENEERENFDLQLKVGDLSIEKAEVWQELDRMQRAYINMRARARRYWRQVIGGRHGGRELNDRLTEEVKHKSRIAKYAVRLIESGDVQINSDSRRLINALVDAGYLDEEDRA